MNKHWYRIMVGKLDFIVWEVSDNDLLKYERVQIKIDGKWYPALRRSQ